MKKTLVALAAVAATSAFADVSITGFIDQAYNRVSNTNASGAKTSSSNLGSNAIGQDQITFGVSEDLGDGMTAYANMRFMPNITGGGNVASDASNVGIKGAFGNLQLASDYGTNWYTANMSDASGWGTGAGNVHGVNVGAIVTDAVIYTLPTFVPGLGVTVVSRPGGDTTGAGNATAYLLSYTTGALSLQYSGAKTKNADAATWQTSGTIGGATAATEAIDNGTTSSGNALAATYDLGVAKLFLGSSTAKSGGDADQKANSTTYGVSVPFGALSVAFASSSATYTALDTSSTKESGFRLLAKYALSKRTSAYFQNGTSKVSNTSRATSSTGLGLIHSF